MFKEKKKSVLTILPHVEDLVQAPVLNAPVANQLWVGGAQVDFLIGQFEEGSVLVWVDTVGAELVEGFVFLLGASGEVRMRLQRGEKTAERSHSDGKTEAQSFGGSGWVDRAAVRKPQGQWFKFQYSISKEKEKNPSVSENLCLLLISSFLSEDSDYTR